MERRRREVDEQLSSGEGEIGRRRAGLPHVFADRDAHEHVAELQQHEIAPGREVAVLVEDAVVRQVALAIDALHRAVGQHGAAVVQVALEQRDADERRDSRATGRDLVERRTCRSDESRTEQEILRRIPRDSQLGEDDQVCALTASGLELSEDPVAIPVEIADDDIDLRQREPHRGILPEPGSPSLWTGFRLTVTNPVYA